MKILLAGGYDTQNLGDHGMLVVFGSDLKKLDPDIEIVLLSRCPDSVFDETYSVRSILNLDHKTKKDSFGRWFNGLNYGDDTNHLQTIWKALETSDLLVIGGGRLFVDITLDFMRGPLPYYALLVTLAKFLGKPIMIFAKTIVPVKTDIGWKHLKYIVSNTDLITVREGPSKQELIGLGIPDNRIRVIPDPAFGLEYKDRKERGSQILIEEGIKVNNKKFIAMNFRYTHLESSIDENYYRLLANICDELYGKLGTDVLLVPQMTYNIDNPYDDDRELYRAIHNLCKFQNNIHIINKRYNVCDTLSIYQCCEMVYSMRRHGIIFAATQYVPVFALSGEKNTSYPMFELNLSKYVVKLSEMKNKNAIEKIILAYKNKEEIRKNLLKSIPKLQKRTLEYACSVQDLIKNKR